MSSSPIPGDVANLGLCALVTIALQASCFLVAYTCQFDLLTDLAGSINFVLLAALTLGLGGAPPRGIAISVLVIISRLELGGFLLVRVCKRGGDARFETIRGSCVAFAGFWTFQAVWAFGVSLPVMYANAVPAASSPAFGTPADIAGCAVFGAAWALQVVADLQKHAFRAREANRGRICGDGVWGYSRHPNFFGEIMMWWAAFILASPDFAAVPWGWATIISPLLTFVILMLASGMPTVRAAAAAHVHARARAELWRAARHASHLAAAAPPPAAPPPLPRRPRATTRSATCARAARATSSWRTACAPRRSSPCRSASTLRCRAGSARTFSSNGACTRLTGHISARSATPRTSAAARLPRALRRAPIRSSR